MGTLAAARRGVLCPHAAPTSPSAQHPQPPREGVRAGGTLRGPSPAGAWVLVAVLGAAEAAPSWQGHGQEHWGKVTRWLSDPRQWGWVPGDTGHTGGTGEQALSTVPGGTAPCEALPGVCSPALGERGEVGQPGPALCVLHGAAQSNVCARGYLCTYVRVRVCAHVGAWVCTQAQLHQAHARMRMWGMGACTCVNEPGACTKAWLSVLQV